VSVSATEAAAWVSGKPSYETEWPECAGRCYDGVCALRYDHPACCFVPRDGQSARHGHHDHGRDRRDDNDDDDNVQSYSDMKADTSGLGHWRSKE